MPKEKQQGTFKDEHHKRATSNSSYQALELDSLDESTNSSWADLAKKYATKPGETIDDKLVTAINITDPGSIDTLVEMDPWTQEWEKQAEKENKS